MAKEVNKRVNIWLNQQGIDNNLKSIRAAITKTANELNKLPIGSELWIAFKSFVSLRSGTVLVPICISRSTKTVNWWIRKVSWIKKCFCSRQDFKQKEAHRTGQIQLPRHAYHEHLWNADATIAPSPERSRENLVQFPWTKWGKVHVMCRKMLLLRR